MQPPPDYTRQIDEMKLKPDDYVCLCEDIQEQINEEEFNGVYTYADTDEFITRLSKEERLNLLSQLQNRLIAWLKTNLKKAKRKKK
jgi:hypothetical protein